VRRRAARASSPRDDRRRRRRPTVVAHRSPVRSPSFDPCSGGGRLLRRELFEAGACRPPAETVRALLGPDALVAVPGGGHAPNPRSPAFRFLNAK
jgi:hypothetical protein